MKSLFTDKPDPYIDPIFSVTSKFNKSENPKKVNLGVGVYRNDEGQSFVLDVVKKVENEISSNPSPNKDYLPICGSQDFINGALKLIFGNNTLDIDDGKIQGVQTLSGTGALRLAIDYLSKFNNVTTFYHPHPTWPIHVSMLNHCDVRKIKQYKYSNPNKPEIMWDNLIKKLNNAPSKSAVIFHLCGHNPTGFDLNEEHWKEIAKVIVNKEIIPIIDCAYLGLGSGCTEIDSFFIRLLYSMGKEMLVCVSFAKNMGLYNERVGLLAWFGANKETSDSIKTRLTLMIRNMYSNPPSHGVKIAARILNDPDLINEWKLELKNMNQRILYVRNELFQSLVRMRTPGDWSFITRQRGLFSLTYFTKQQVEYLEKNYDIFMPENGRINVSAITSSNLEYISKAFHDSVVNCPQIKN